MSGESKEHEAPGAQFVCTYRSHPGFATRLPTTYPVKVLSVFEALTQGNSDLARSDAPECHQQKYPWDTSNPSIEPAIDRLKHRLLGCAVGSRAPLGGYLAHMAYVEDSRCLADCHVFFDCAGILDWHVPTAKIHHPSTGFTVNFIEGGFSKGFRR